MYQSEVARLRQEIDTVCAAMQSGISGYAIKAKHEIVAHQYQMLNDYHEQLIPFVGNSSAIEMIIEAIDQSLTQSHLSDCARQGPA